MLAACGLEQLHPLIENGGIMFGSVILDMAIGMVYIYLLLSLVASVINEALAGLVQSRAANLQRGLRSLLSGDSIEAGALTLVDNIYNHGLIRGLYQDPATRTMAETKDAETCGEEPVLDLKADLSQLGWWSKCAWSCTKLVGIAPGKELRAYQTSSAAFIYPGAGLCAGDDRHPEQRQVQRQDSD